MEEITDEVCEFLLSNLEKALEGRPELRRCQTKPGLKLLMRKNRAYLSLGFPSLNDKVVSYKGSPVLIIAAGDVGQLNGIRLLVRCRGAERVLSLEPEMASWQHCD